MEAITVLEDDYAHFCRLVKRLSGIDLTSYRSAQMRRRLTMLMQRCGASDFIDYARLIQKDQARRAELENFITINVSEFFRDPAKFQLLRERVLPELLHEGGSLNIWSAGCSNGSEPYSVAMILEEMGIRDYSILATDIDKTVIERARRGADYRAEDVRHVPAHLQAKYLAVENGRFAVKDEARRHVRFAIHDLLNDPFGRDYDLILCRNVTIYFTDAAKDVLYRRFHAALRPNGVLFIGGTEAMLRSKELGFHSKAGCFYWKDVGADGQVAGVAGRKVARAS